jgi:hypothetical protein
VSDRLYLSCWLRLSHETRGFDAASMLRHFIAMLEVFPFSKLARRGPLLRVYAIDYAEPPLLEREFAPGTPPEMIVEAAREFMHEDCTCQVETFWDLWQHDQEWKLEPAAITLACFGPGFENETKDHLRIEFGLDARFLPQPNIAGSARLVQSNIRSLLHLVGELKQSLNLERQQLWSESGVNFAELLAHTLEAFNAN